MENDEEYIHGRSFLQYEELLGLMELHNHDYTS